MMLEETILGQIRAKWRHVLDNQASFLIYDTVRETIPKKFDRGITTGNLDDVATCVTVIAPR